MVIGPFAAVEGTALPLDTTVGSFDVADPLAVAGNYKANIDWGDGSPNSVGTVQPGVTVGGTTTFAVTGNHTYAETGTYTITVQFSDNYGTTVSSTAIANVADAALVPNIGPAVPPFNANEGQLLTNIPIATFFDLNPDATADDFTGLIDWGDGTPLDVPVFTYVGNSWAHLALAGVRLAHVHEPRGLAVHGLSGGPGQGYFGPPPDSQHARCAAHPHQHGDRDPGAAGSAGNLHQRDRGLANDSWRFRHRRVQRQRGRRPDRRLQREHPVGRRHVRRSVLRRDHRQRAQFQLVLGDCPAGRSHLRQARPVPNHGDRPRRRCGGRHRQFVRADRSRGDQHHPGVVIGPFAATEGIPLPPNTTVGSFDVADPLAVASEFTAIIDWGDGSPISIGTIQPGVTVGGITTFAVTGNHTYVETGTYTITVQFRDAFGTTVTSTAIANVADAASPIPLP